MNLSVRPIGRKIGSNACSSFLAFSGLRDSVSSCRQAHALAGFRKRQSSFSSQRPSNLRSKSSSSSSPPPADSKKKIVSTLFNKVPSRVDNIGAKDLALDMFFSGYRPLFLMDHFKVNDPKIHKPAAERDLIPWDVSAAGMALNPEMKNVPREIVRNLQPYVAPMGQEQAVKVEQAKSKARSDLLSGRPGNGVITLEIHNGLVPNGTVVNVLVNGDGSNHEEILRQLMRFRSYFLKAVSNLPQQTASNVQFSPVSSSFGRVMHATSVKRKRKLKMTRHKLKKRRKLQRALKRKLNR